MIRAAQIVAALALIAVVGVAQCVVPYTEDFESATVPGSAATACVAAGTLPTGWTNDPTGTNGWTPWTGSTPTSNIGPSGDHTTGNGKYVYVEGSSCSNYTGILNAPCYDVSAVVTPTVEFWAHMRGSGSTLLECQEFDGVNWNPIWSLAGDQGNQWIFASAALTPIGGQVNIRFVAMGVNWTADIAIDDVKVGEPSGNDWQVNQPEFGIDVDGVTTIGISAPAAVFLQSINCTPVQPANATLNIDSTLPGAPWELGIVNGNLIPASSPGSNVFPDGTIANINLADPTLQFLSNVLGNGTMFLPSFPGAQSISISIPFEIVGPTDIAIQAYVVNPAAFLGLTVSQGVEVHVAAQGSAPSIPGPSTNDTSVAIDVTGSPACWTTTGVDFYGTTYTTIYVSDNGRVTFGSADDDNTATLAEALAGVPFVGLWSDFNPGQSGNITVTNPQANVIRVNYNSIPFTGGGGNTTGHGIEFDLLTGDITIDIGPLAMYAGIGPQHARFLGVSGGAALPATDPGATVFTPGSVGIPLTGTDMIYDFLDFGLGSQFNSVTAGVTQLQFVNVGGFYSWVAN